MRAAASVRRNEIKVGHGWKKNERFVNHKECERRVGLPGGRAEEAFFERMNVSRFAPLFGSQKSKILIFLSIFRPNTSR